METLYIALDGGRKLTIGSLQSLESKSFKLRTVDINQFQAKISVGITGGEENHIFHSVFLKNLRPASNGYSYLDCRVARRGRRLSLVIKNERSIVCDDVFSLLTPAAKKKILFGSLGGAAALILIVALLLFLDLSALDSGLRGNQTLSGNRTAFSTSRPASINQSSSSRQSASSMKPASGSREASSNMAVTDNQVASIDQTESNSQRTQNAGTDQNAGTEAEAKKEEPVRNDEPEEMAPALLPLSERTVLFTPNSSRLTNEGIGVLKKILPLLLEEPSLHVSITGHCAIAGTEAGRREISIQRADNVEAWLKNSGWIPNKAPTVGGEAGDFPLTLDPDKQEMNRRVEISY